MIETYEIPILKSNHIVMNKSIGTANFLSKILYKFVKNVIFYLIL